MIELLVRKTLTMSLEAWMTEMNRMIDAFASVAAPSLLKIYEMGRPFDDEFRQYFLEASNQRYVRTLVIAFESIALENVFYKF